MLDIFSIPTDSFLIQGNYNSYLVAVSVLIAIFASLMAFQVATQASQSTHAKRKVWSTAAGTFALGGGVWSMHFIGMLAFDLCTKVDYDPVLTSISIIPSLGAAWVALSFLIKGQVDGRRILVSGVLMGAGIGTMHYMGMAAMDMAPSLRYDLAVFLLSIVVAVILSVLSLGVRCMLLRWNAGRVSPTYINLIAAVIMGTAIAGMHYTGMAAARFVKPDGLELSTQSSQISLYLAMGVTIATVVMIMVVIAVNTLMTFKEISDRSQRSENRVRAMMETAVDGIISIDQDGTIRQANKAITSILGWKVDELLNQNVRKLVPEELAPQHDNFIQQYIETGNARIIGKGREVQALHKDGFLVPVRLGIGHMQQDGKHYFVGFISDLSERVKMEQAIRENEAKFRSLITNIPGIAYRSSPKDGWPMVFISDAVEDITGYPAQDFLLPNPKRFFAELIHPDDLPEIEASIEGKKTFSIEYRLIDKYGSEKWMFEHGNLVDEGDGQVWLDGFIMDMSDRKVMEQELVSAKDKAELAANSRAAFLANMSHEIRTPMNAIIGFSDVLLNSELPNEQLQQVNTINSSAKSLLHLLNDILDSAKLEKGKFEIELRPFNLMDEVDAVVSTLWLGAKKKGLDFTAQLDSQLQAAYIGAPERIRQVLINLIGNAIKFTEVGEVTLQVNAKSSGVEFVISDTGIGMSEQQVANVFDAFSQADASMSRRFGGTGLGTTISKQLVELMGGDLEVSSQLGEGTEFRFFLPLEASEQPSSKTSNTFSVELPPLNILIVDDIQQNLDLLEILLSRQGHSIVRASNGAEALHKMDVQLDLVLMDLQMPVLDGLEASKARRAIEKEHDLVHLPIIALTASVLDDDIREAKAAGMDGFANKPVDIDILNQEIATVLGITISPTLNEKKSDSELHVVDESRGTAVWGSKREFINQLNVFIEQWPERLATIEQAFIKSDDAKLHSGLHALKGLAGNLALQELYNVTLAYESDLEAAKQTYSKGQLVSKLTNCILQIEEWLANQSENQQVETQQSDSEVMNTTLVITTIEKLNFALSKHELDDELVIELQSMLPSQYQKMLSNVQTAIDDFEFTQAQQHLDELRIAIEETI